MGITSLRSLLLAAIVLSNCITWTASRHHYTHNVNGHRSRHRRQGANLFLPASYVIPGGEGSGPWGEWGDVSPCSRTCGGGVASQKRICLAVGSDGPPCTGGDTKYFSCQTQDCPEGAGDFRSEQCAEFNDKLFRDNNRYSWIPYTKAQNPCELNCMPKGERFYYRQRLRVVDGTRCNDESFDVCVNGTCQAVGCDMMLGSNAREDKCRVCRGNGTNCRTMEGLIEDPELRRGYNDVLLIPQGATNILIEEIKDSSNYLALRAKEQAKYYLNGDYHIDFPRSLLIAGALWHYERSQQGFAAPDKLRCIGPTDEPLYLSLLLQEDNVGVKYEYSIPSDLAPRPTQQYGWVFKPFSPCSATCGGGFQMRKVTCRSREELEEVDPSLCDEALKPATNQTCNIQPCSARWVEGPWSPCSKPCGEGGTRSRQVHCEKVITDGVTLGLRSTVPDSECFDLLGAKPKLYEECNQNATCPTWFTGPWKPCDKLCGEGKQTRQVVCHTRVKGRVQVFDDNECGEEKPPSEQPCNLHPCGGIDWVLSDWTGCDSCLSKTRTRIGKCATQDREVVKFELCAYHPVPILEEPCDLTKLPPCEVQWYATQWSSCSVECGKGVQTRHVFCGMFDGTSVTKVDDSKCDQQEKYKDSKPCEVPKEKCPAKWYTGPWSECSKKCGGGEQKRQVMCLIDEKVVGTCDQESTPDSLQTCNIGPCNEDEILPVDSKSTPIMDSDYDYEGEDCEDEAYDEVGAEEEDEDLSLNYPEEKMYSDSPSTFEGSGEYESVFTTDTGSGSELTSITIEGSGSAFDETTETEWTGSTSSWETTEISVTMESSSTESESTRDTESTETGSTVSEVTSSDQSSSTESIKIETGSTESTVTDTTKEISTESTNTESSASTETTVTGSTESTVTGSTETATSTVTSVTGSSETTESGSTSSTEINTTETGSTETGSTGSTETDLTISTESTETAETSSTDSTVTDLSETTETSSTEPTETTNTESVSTDTSETTKESSVTTESSTDVSTSESSTMSGSTESSEKPESTTDISTESSSTSEAVTEETVSMSVSSEGTTESSSTISSIGDTASTEGSTSEGSTESSTTESGVTSESTAITSSTEESTTGSDTTESESSTSAETEVTATTESSSTETAESSTTSETESTLTEETGSTQTDTTESTESTVTESTGSTEMSSTEATETTLTGLSTTEESTTFSSISTSESWASTIQGIHKKPKCKRRKIAKCLRSKFGCCPDKKTPATGPFDEGCPTPKTCKETKFGCCDDGVSPASGPEKKGCPMVNCKDTLYGCCLSDNVTPAEGNDQEGCPKPIPACEKSKYGCCKDGETKAKGPKKKGCPETETKKPETKPKGCEASKFGCCADNKTEAAGPDGAGCPCNTTKFGCCPDGVSPATSADKEGCVTSCNSSEHGCCPDGKTPAHGPDFEGCCLQSPFGCCPDNYKPADGPHLEGCECEHSRYGCCPDNVTIARGPYNEGCGCKHSQFGCCPDRHTEAKGPNFEGCDCSTYQFGCCSDGQTAAKGPGQQGCHCQQTEFGCCGDGKTAAEGPDQLGCNCASSRFGCCPDGVTEAKGEKFLNCTDVPENRQAACSLATDRGPCRNFTVYWFYDMTYGGCSRFWYGGCEGNGNRFSSKEECEDICVQPNPKDTCKLPKVKGPCNNRHLRWHYDSNREQCMQFEFGGCLGNANNFESRELCQKQCEPDKTEDQCTLPIERGPCAGNFGRWGYDAETGSCEQFIWGGCEGNSNRFSSKAACLQRCNPPGVQKPECSQPQESGNCTDKLALWSFSAVENRCLPFYYSGCGGNDNRFDSEAACAENCPSAYVQETCALPALTGECADYTLRWFFDTSENRCRQFYYGGCGGNENNFVTEEQCIRSCSEQQLTTTTVTPVYTQPALPDVCFLERDPGPCNNYETRWSYDSIKGKCFPFEYGGCGGNQNNFRDETKCQYYCTPAQDACQLPALPGPCGDWSLQWFYNTSVDTCEQFYYGGCEGNDNRFESQQACEIRCKKSEGLTVPATTTTRRTTRIYTTPTTTTTTTTTTIAPSFRVPSGCEVSSGPLEECVEAGVVWYFDLNQGACVSHGNAASGTNCVRRGAYSSQEACERACGAFNGLDVCRYEVDAGPCNGVQAKVYWDAERGACEQFVYGGCLGGPNRFSSISECEQICKPQTDPCKQPSESGNCLEYFIKWYYDELRNDCGQFVYTGCGGNDNRFETKEECLGRCVRRDTTTIRVATAATAPTTTTLTTTTSTTTLAPAPPPAQGDEECRTPFSLEPCGRNITIYYYDTRTGACLRGDFGGCKYVNSYSSEEECERQCGAFRNVDVCRAPLDPGPCSQSVPKVYWDARSGRCLQFAYGGCQGGPNRFSSVQECEDVCGDTGPEAACLQEVHSGAAGCGQPARRWRYDAAAADCRAFVFLGCGGNANNFLSFEECAARCLVDGDNAVVPECERFNEECERIRCDYGVERAQSEYGCERCVCAPAPADRCQRFREQCESLQCPVARTVDADGCERCDCLDDPCVGLVCPAGERCKATLYRNPVTGDPEYLTECRAVNKSGACPYDSGEGGEGDEGGDGGERCVRECNDDADCAGVGKCCARGCGARCLPPAALTTTRAPLTTTTYIPDVPLAPQANLETQPEVSVAEGGKATLRCLFHGNPPPSITWRHGEITIESDMDRYRLLSDGALEIVSIYRNDSGVYICIGNNALGTATQQIHLEVNDPEEGSAGIAGAANAVVGGELGRPVNIRCLAFGYPPPSIYWYRGRNGPMVPYSSALYEARGNVLQIRSLTLETIGEYICQAYNGIGKPAEWAVTVQINRPQVTDYPWTVTRTPTTERDTTTTHASVFEYSVFTVPVRTSISVERTTVAAGSELSVPCAVDGYPVPQVYWTKDSVRLVPTDRIMLTDARLIISGANINDSGEYGCHAGNAFSSHSSTVQITVEGLYIPPKCTDNPFFANCALIVRSKYCKHQYYSRFCCKSCVEAGQLNPLELDMQADEAWRKRK